MSTLVADREIPGNSKSALWLFVALSLLSGVVLVWSIFQLRAAHRQLNITRGATGECRSIGRSIGEIAARPEVAALVAESPQELIRRIASSLDEAGIGRESLLAVTPAEVMRIVSTDYQQRLTEVELKGVSLPMLASFYDALGSGDGLYLNDLLLIPALPPGTASEGQEVWDARLTLTQIIYSPTSP
jgi:hypothetical protein